MKRILLICALCLSILLSCFEKAYSQNAIVIDSGSTWKYLAQSSAPSANWKGGAAFDDSGWPSGPAKFGFGAEGEVTCVPAGCGSGCTPGNCGPKFITTYFRKTFTILDPTSYTGFLVRLLRDDGAVVYVNGIEVFRSNMPAGTIAHSTLASSTVGDVPADEFTYFNSPVIPNTAFMVGTNVIAVEIHQVNNTSSDLGFNLQLIGQLSNSNTLLNFGATWKYWADLEVNAPSSNWKGGGVFDDSGWPSGPGRLGFGDDGEVTCIPAGCGTGCTPGNCATKFNTTYFRTTVNIPNVNAYSGFFINITRDDGAIIYVNGVEVWRTGMPEGPITYSTFAVTDPVAQSDGQNEMTVFTSPLISPSVFQNGVNTIAVEVHQLNNISSDLGLDLQLMGQPFVPVNSLIPFGASWKYWANTQANAPTANWKGGGAYDESNWTQAITEIGFGDGGEATCIPGGCISSGGSVCSPGSCATKFMTTYFRKTIYIANVAGYTGFTLNLIRDDGAVVYVNGVEVWRTNMPASPASITYATAALTADGGTEGQVHTVNLGLTGFVSGNNVIAVEIHQNVNTSSDLSFNLELTGSAATNVLNYGASWKYWANTEANAPAASWKNEVFNDGTWATGVSKFGFGGDGEATCIPAGCITGGGSVCLPGNCDGKFTTIYFRTTINLVDADAYAGYLINLIRDDGAVVYVNGVEVWRTNMPGGTIQYNTFSSALTDGTNETTAFVSSFIPSSAFHDGVNTIAVEIHQVNSTSSDLGMNMQIQGQFIVPANEVVYYWSGAIRPTEAKVNAKLTIATTQARLLVSTSATLSSPIYGPYVIADAGNNLVAAMSITGLAPNTKYYYAIEADGIVDNSADDVGTFTTPNNLPFSYKFTIGSCLNSNTNHPVFNRISDKNPLFFLSMGDFHYDNPNSSTDVNVHRNPYETNLLSKSNYKAVFQNYPIAYVWDDHDFSGNDSDSTAVGKANARRAYREYVPHYTLGTEVPGTNGPIYQSFTIGRIHFILSDLRSSRRTPTMMGDLQKAWFKQQCLYARDNNLIIAWMTSVSFGGNISDNWGGFTSERTELSNFFRDNGIRNMFIMSGDAHMAAIDNGTNHDFSTGNNNPYDYPVLAAAGLNQNGSTKGGTYSELGPHANRNSTWGQYGFVEVTDIGGNQITIRLTAYEVDNNGNEFELASYEFVRTVNLSVPVKFNSFSVRATQNENAVLLNWKTSEDMDCEKFIVERSKDGISFATVTTVKCQGTPTATYNFEDLNANNGWNYYRVKSVEKSGKESYTAIQRIHLTGKMIVRLSPNPVNELLRVEVKNASADDRGRYIIYNTKFQSILQGKVKLIEGDNEFRVQTNQLPAGLYVLHLVMNGSEIKQRFIVQ